MSFKNHKSANKVAFFLFKDACLLDLHQFYHVFPVFFKKTCLNIWIVFKKFIPLHSLSPKTVAG